MAKQTFEKGTSVDLRAKFTNPNAAGAALDPTGLTLVIRSPDATVVTIAFVNITKESVGNYLYVLATPLEGTYNWRWHASSLTKSIVLPGSLDSKRDVEF